MLRFLVQFAAADNDFSQNVKAATEKTRFNAQEMMVAISIGVGIGVLLFVWAYLRFRKKPGVVTREDLPRAKPVAPAVAPVEDTEDGGDPERRRRRKKRRRRRDHRPRNPSLQQTGGLPPPRPDDQLPKY